MRTVLTFICTIVLALGFLQPVSAQQLDSATMASIDAKLGEYLTAMAGEGVEVQKRECDFLISTCTDSLVRQAVAVKAYSHYLTSKVMGAEAVAIHILDRWFLTGEVEMYSSLDLLNARIYADFNRSSQIGKTAPELKAESFEGDSLQIFPSGGTYKILYFYDSDCSSCKAQTILMRNVLAAENYPVDLVAFYAGDSREQWASYISEQLDIDADRLRILNVWDKELDSDFQRKYGVLKTPMMFLIDPADRIVGRKLDAQALYVMLDAIFSEPEMTYGSEESVALFDNVFKSGEAEPSSADVAALIDYIRSSTIEKGDILMFKQLSGDLLYYLSAEKGEAFKEGTAYLIDKCILTDEGVWTTEDDSLKVVGMAQMLNEFLKKNRPGTRLPELKLPATVCSWKSVKEKQVRFDRLPGKSNLIIFYSEGCSVCKAEKAAALEMLAAAEYDKSLRQLKVLMVNVDEILSSTTLGEGIFDHFDLSSIPFILTADRKGTVIRRYISLITK